MGQVEGLPCWDFKARHCYHHSTSCGPTSSFNGPKPVSLAHVSVILCPEGITYHHWGRMGALRLYEVKKAKRLINKIILLPSRLKKGRFLSKQKCKHLTFFFLLHILPAFYSKDFIFLFRSSSCSSCSSLYLARLVSCPHLRLHRPSPQPFFANSRLCCHQC